MCRLFCVRRKLNPPYRLRVVLIFFFFRFFVLSVGFYDLTTLCARFRQKADDIVFQKDSILFSWLRIVIFFFRLTRAYISPKINHRLSETEAGRKFLQALRERHEEDEDVGPQVQASSIIGSVYRRDNLKQKRTKLRASLEELIVEYLRSLAPDNDDQHLDRRHKRDINKNSIDTLSDDVHKNISGSEKSAINAIVVKNESHVSDESDDERVQIDSENGTSSLSSPKNVCVERKQRITQLDRIELEKALQNESDYEHNIRRILNYR